jgi:regulatory protein
MDAAYIFNGFIMKCKITALKAQKRNSQRINVYLDGEFAFGLSRIVAAWLQVGLELTPERIEQLRAEDEREIAYQKALKLIDYRFRSEAEIRRNLGRNKLDNRVITDVLDRLRSNGLVDDAKFAQNWVENRKEFRPRSQRALRFELIQRGVQQEIIEKAIHSFNEEEMAYQAALRQSRKIKFQEWKEYRQKMLRHLAQRGFSYETSTEAAQRVWADITRQAQNVDEGTEE